MVGELKICAMPRRLPKIVSILLRTRIASIESPPNSKKLSVFVMGATARTFSQISLS